MSGELTARVTKVIAVTQKIPEESVTVDKTFEDLKIDSLDGLNILFALETEFNVDIPDDAMRSTGSVGDVVRGIEKLLASKEEK